jgi:hypothetical protein
MSRTWDSLHPATRADITIRSHGIVLLDGPTVSAQALIDRAPEGRLTVSRFKCGCDLYSSGESWLCAYHEGYDGASNETVLGERLATAADVLDEVERRLRDTEWSSHPGDRCRTALLHIDAYRRGTARAAQPKEN